MAPINDQAASNTDHYDGSLGEEGGFLGVPPLPDMFYVRPDDLPPRAQARVMVDYFASHTWQLYPLVDINSLKATYEQLQDSAAEYARHTLSDKPGHMVDPLRIPRNQPIIALHFVVFALVQSISEAPFTRIDGESQVQSVADLSAPLGLENAPQASRLAAQHTQSPSAPDRSAAHAGH